MSWHEGQEKLKISEIFSNMLQIIKNHSLAVYKCREKLPLLQYNWKVADTKIFPPSHCPLSSLILPTPRVCSHLYSDGMKSIGQKHFCWQCSFGVTHQNLLEPRVRGPRCLDGFRSTELTFWSGISSKSLLRSPSGSPHLHLWRGWLMLL